MRLQDLNEKAPSSGSYVCVKFDEDTVESLKEFQKLHHIANATEATDLHITVVYSRAPVHWRAAHDIHHVPKPIGYEVWETKDEKHCLVLRVECPYLDTRFALAMDRGATYDFDEYKPHISLSYDVGEDFDADDLPLPEFEIVIDREEFKPLSDD